MSSTGTPHRSLPDFEEKEKQTLHLYKLLYLFYGTPFCFPRVTIYRYLYRVYMLLVDSRPYRPLRSPVPPYRSRKAQPKGVYSFSKSRGVPECPVPQGRIVSYDIHTVEHQVRPTGASKCPLFDVPAYWPGGFTSERTAVSVEDDTAHRGGAFCVVVYLSQ